MNGLVQADAQIIHRLALGLEPVDAARGGRIHHLLHIEAEGRERRRRISRHDTCRHVLLYEPDLGGQIDLRIYDRERQYVPRRFRIPLLSLADVLAAEQAGSAVPAALRVRRPALFPGAAYDVSDVATGLRGRVLRGGVPLRWARVEAFLPIATAPLVGRAHGDERGEFLLLLAPQAVSGAELPESLEVRVVIYGPQPPPMPIPPSLPQADRWWDLPLEQLPLPGAPDLVSPGTVLPVLPAPYVEGARRQIAFPYGRILSRSDGIADFDFAPP